MNKLSAFALIAALLILAAPGTGALAKMKIRIHDHQHHHDEWKISCNTARHMVQERGFNPVRVKSCISTVYSFYAVRKGRTYIFRVDSRTGFISRG